MALRAVGKRNPSLHATALEVAMRLSQSKEPAFRWIGKEALRELSSPKVNSRMARRAKA